MMSNNAEKTESKAQLLISKAIELVPQISESGKNVTDVGGLLGAIMKAVYAKQPQKVQKLIYENGLDKPENLIKFLLDLHFASFDAVYEGINDVREDIQNQTTGKIDSAHTKCLTAFHNPRQKEMLLDNAFCELVDASSILEKQIMTYINKYQIIDNRKGIKALLYSKSDYKNVKQINHMVTIAMHGYFEALNLIAIVGTERSMDMTAIFDSANQFLSKLENEHMISLAAAYDEKREETYWNQQELRKTLNKIQEQQINLSEFVDNQEFVEVDFEDLLS